MVRHLGSLSLNGKAGYKCVRRKQATVILSSAKYPPQEGKIVQIPEASWPDPIGAQGPTGGNCPVGLKPALLPIK